MKIERIDDKTVKCFISNEELEEYDITYKDFVIRSDKAKELMEEIIGQAEEELGYQPPKYAFDLQIMMLPEQGMVLTFSEKNEENVGENLLECLNEMKQMMTEKQKELTQNTKKEIISKGQNKIDKKNLPTFAVFAFNNLNDIIRYAQALPKNLRIKSALYKLEETFYLYLDKGSASYPRYSRACVQAMEFAQLYTAEEGKLTYLKEHAECLIAEHAAKVLHL